MGTVLILGAGVMGSAIAVPAADNGHRVRLVGNLVADAVERAAPVPDRGSPHILLIPGSRNRFAVPLIPLRRQPASKREGARRLPAPRPWSCSPSWDQNS